MTPKQLLLNHSRGLNSNAHVREAQYTDTEIPRITDLTDIAENRKKLEAEKEQLDLLVEIEKKEKADKQRLKDEKAKKESQDEKTEKPLKNEPDGSDKPQ